jgi:Zn-dependent oligopeptidase
MLALVFSLTYFLHQSIRAGWVFGFMYRRERQYKLFVPEGADAHVYASFPQLGNALYTSDYSQFMWAKVIAEDFFQQFDQHNLLASDAPMRCRRLVLEPGGSMSANDLVKNFLGRPQNMTAFQRWMGEEFESAPQSKPSSGH